MTHMSDEFDELRQLLDALCEESISPAQVRRMEELVLGRPEAEAYYVQYMALYADLSRRFAGRPAVTEQSLRDRLAERSAAAAAPAPRVRPLRGRSAVLVLAAVAAGVLVSVALLHRPAAIVPLPDDVDVACAFVDQQKAIDDFVRRGGGVLVTLGSNCLASAWNEHVFREGQGWLPARLIEPKGDENAIDRAPVLLAEGLEQHPALALVKSNEKGSLKSAYFPRYWALDTAHAGSGAAIATLTSGDPLFAEKITGKGKTIVSAASSPARGSGSSLSASAQRYSWIA